MKNTKKLLMSLALITAAGVATGCSNQRKIAILHPEIVPLETLRAKYSKSNPIEIDFWSNFGASMTSYVETALDAFQEKYDFIKVTHEGKGGYEGLQNAMIKSLNSSSYPNVAVGYPDHFANYIAASIQYELDTFIENDEYGLDLGDYHENYLRENQSLFYKDGAAKTQPYTVALPYNKSTEVMVYNKSLFEALGLTVPKTWEEVEEVGEAIITALDGHFGTNYTINYGDGKSYTVDLTSVTKDEFYPLSWDSQANFFITMAYQFGGEYTEMGDTLETGYIKFNNPEVVEALTYIQSLGKNGKHILGIPGSWDEPSFCSGPFKANKSVMTISSSAGVSNNIPAGNKFEVGISSIPYKDAARKFVISQGANLAIFKDTNADRVNASWLLIRYLTGGEASAEENANVDFCISSGYLPVTKSGEDSEWYQQYISSADEGTPVDKAKIAVQKMANETYVNENWNKFVDPAFIGSAVIRNNVEKIIPSILTGSGGVIYTPQRAIDYVYTILARYQKKDK